MDDNQNIVKQTEGNQCLLFHSGNQKSLLQIRRTNQSLRFEMYGIPNQHYQKLNMYDLQIPDVKSIPQLDGYFDTSHHFIQFIRDSSNMKINYEKGIIQILSKHPTKQDKNITIAELKLNAKQLLDNKNFIQISTRCLSSDDLSNQEIKHMLLGLSQQLMTLSQKPLRKKDKSTHQNEGQEKIEGVQKVRITKSLLQIQIDSVKQIMGKKLGKIMDEVQKSRQILLTQLQSMRNKLSELQTNIQSNNSKTKEQFKNLILIDKIQLQQKMNTMSKNSMNVGGLQRISPFIPPPMMPLPFQGMIRPPSYQQLYKTQYGKPVMRPQLKVDKKEQQNDRTKIGQIQPGQQYTKIKAKVLKLIQRRNKVEVILGDQTGIVNGYLNKCDQIRVDNTIILLQCRAQVYRQHIQIQLKRGGRILLVPKKDQITHVESSNNISLKQWIQSEI